MSQVFQSSALCVVATGVQIPTSGVSASASIPNASSGEAPRYIRVAATAAACVKIGSAGVTATTGDLQVQPGDAAVLQVPSGLTQIAAIQVSSAGVVQISPLENM
ncbi:MAG TPA: hypothetical protein VF472_21830 [Burkholderiaceae bacterium]